jgi:hypothetical protein
MRALLRILGAGAAVGLFAVNPVAGEWPSGPAGKSRIAHLYLAEKDATWQVVPGGAWGKLKYNTSGPSFDFVFNGHKLEPGVAYTLMYYPDPWPGIGAICLGEGITDSIGDLQVKGSPDIDSLPVPTDWNAIPSKTTYTGPPPKTGAKIWLVLSTDVACGMRMLNWEPTEYLLEMQLISYIRTN